MFYLQGSLRCDLEYNVNAHFTRKLFLFFRQPKQRHDVNEIKRSVTPYAWKVGGQRQL